MLKEMQPAKIDDYKNGQSVDEKKNASMELKDKGNEAMTKQAYSEAARLYSESINLDPDNTISYNNRAQALLKLSRFVEAEKDAAVVIAKFSSEKSSPHFKKASFRRALALRGMGGEKNLASAIALLEELSKLDPENKDVKLELGRSSQLQKNAFLSDKSGSAASSSPISPALDMTVRASKKRTPTSSQTEDIPLPRPHPIDSASTDALSEFPPAAPAPNINSKSTVSTRSPNKAESPAVAGASTRLSKEPEVPDTLPATVYELERTWRALKSHPKLFATYLSRFKTSTFKKVFKEAVSSELLSSMMIALRDHGNPDDIIAVFTGFSSSASFDMTIMMLPEEDTNNVKTIIAKLDGNDPKVQVLKAKYKV
jgi:tetratricopeptide (TPR) repeat protein